MSAIGTIKQNIVTHLNALQTASTLGQVIVEQAGASNMFDRDLITYPAAILLPGTAAGNVETNQDNLYLYAFDIVVVMKSDNIVSQTAIEEICLKLSSKNSIRTSLSVALQSEE